jgi:hypothetical protein
MFKIVPAFRLISPLKTAPAPPLALAPEAPAAVSEYNPSCGIVYVTTMPV